jgi:hypothetical protein
VASPETYAATQRNAALLLAGTLGLLALLVGAVAAALSLATTGDQLMPMILGILGVFVAGFVVLVLASLRRHRWTVQPGHLVIEERPWLRFTGSARQALVAFSDIVGLATVQNGAMDVIELATRQGARFRMGPATLKPDGPGVAAAMRAVDSAGLGAFAARLQAAMREAGVAPPALLPGMGFWNRPLGLALLGLLLVLSLGLAVGTVVAVLGGAGGGRNTSEAAGVLVLLPFGVGWMLRRAWQRRQAALRARA